ncbi:MAG: hypothetical protein IT236_07165, partial [Bacteroidia bacterium]|nr:hypothetical protein [Bacteroidia bacterium]
MRFFLYLLLLAFLPIAKSQNFDSLCRQQLNVLTELNQKHIQFPVLNEKTKTEITDLFLKLADERNMIALSPDKKTLEQILIKDTSSKAFCSFIEKSHAIFSQRLQQVDSIINGIEKKQIQFPAKDSVTFFSNPNNRYYRENLSELSNRIDMLIKYDCIQFLLSNKKDSVDVL